MDALPWLLLSGVLLALLERALPRFLPSLGFPPDKPPRRTYVPNTA
jgi:hypothetical protein